MTYNAADNASNTSVIEPGTIVAVTPNDSTVLNLRGIYVGGAGNLSVMDMAGNTVTFTALPVGTQLRLRIARVRSTGTTATNLVGWS